MIELFVGVVSYVKIVVDVIHIFYAPKKKVFMNIIVFEYKQREKEREKVSVEYEFANLHEIQFMQSLPL